MNINSQLPEVQLKPLQPEIQEHDRSMCLHVSGLQLGEQTLEQFVP